MQVKHVLSVRGHPSRDLWPQSFDLWTESPEFQILSWKALIRAIIIQHLDGIGMA